MQSSRRWLVLIISVLIGNAFAIAGLYVHNSAFALSIAQSLCAKSDQYAAVAAGGAFSLLGFLAAVTALFSLIGQSAAMTIYRKNGYLWGLLCGIAVTMIETSIAFVFAISLFFSPVTLLRIELSLVSLAGSLGMMLVCIVPSLALQARAAVEH